MFIHLYLVFSRSACFDAGPARATLGHRCCALAPINSGECFGVGDLPRGFHWTWAPDADILLLSFAALNVKRNPTRVVFTRCPSCFHSGPIRSVLQLRDTLEPPAWASSWVRAEKGSWCAASACAQTFFAEWQALKDPFADALGGVPPGIFGVVDKDCNCSFMVKNNANLNLSGSGGQLFNLYP